MGSATAVHGGSPERRRVWRDRCYCGRVTGHRWAGDAGNPGSEWRSRCRHMAEKEADQGPVQHRLGAPEADGVEVMGEQGRGAGSSPGGSLWTTEDVLSGEKSRSLVFRWSHLSAPSPPHGPSQAVPGDSGHSTEPESQRFPFKSVANCQSRNFREPCLQFPSSSEVLGADSVRGQRPDFRKQTNPKGA